MVVSVQHTGQHKTREKLHKRTNWSCFILWTELLLIRDPFLPRNQLKLTWKGQVMSAWLHIFQWSMRNPVFRSVGIIFTLHLCVEYLVFFLNQKGNIARLDLMLFWGVSGPVALEEFSGPSFGPIESLTGPPPRYTSCSASVTAWIIKMIRHTPDQQICNVIYHPFLRIFYLPWVRRMRPTNMLQKVNLWLWTNSPSECWD